VISKKRLCFFAFAIVVLQIADAGLLWLVGASKNQYGDTGFQADTFMFSAAIFCIAKCLHKKYFQSSVKESSVEEETKADVVPEEEKVKAGDEEGDVSNQQPTMKVVASNRKQPGSKPTLRSHSWVPRWLKASIPIKPSSASSEATALNPKAKKFVPAVPSNTLDSDAPVFIPSAHVQKECELLKTHNPGSVMYRSRHWLQEISPNTKAPEAQKAAEVQLVPANATRKQSKSPEPAPVKRWRPKDQVKWTSNWSQLTIA